MIVILYILVLQKLSICKEKGLVAIFVKKNCRGKEYRDHLKSRKFELEGIFTTNFADV